MNKEKQPAVLFLDIETSPITGYTWRSWQDNLLKILEPSKILSIAWKWQGQDTVQCKTIADYKGYKKGQINDEKLVKEAWELLDESDIVIAHHGKKFDLPKLNARFIYYDLKAPSSYQVIDTKVVASRNFKFDSNSLNNLGQYLGCGTKVENSGFSLWSRCIEGDPEAWKLMKEYNSGDVSLLEAVYLKLRPYIQNHPSLTLISGKDTSCCPTCQSDDLQKRGFSYTRTGSKQRFLCNSCGSWSSGSFVKNKNSNILYSSEE